LFGFNVFFFALCPQLNLFIFGLHELQKSFWR
jgi:hypothetical protein